MRANSKGERLGHHQQGSGNKNHGIYLGKVKENVDPQGLGRLQVWIPQVSAANENDKTGWFTMRYCPPFAGAGDTSAESQANDATKYKQTNQSYGVWMVPPDKNVQVICGFINGEIHQGIWWACLPHDGHTHAIPAIASGSTHEGEVAPVAERNRFNSADPQQENRPKHIVGDVIKGQGLERDRQRGHTNAGPFRNSKKHTGFGYGILTPGQHQFVMDDGPDGRSGQIRLRTQSGNSIIMDNNCGFIYIINANGSAWVQLDKKGNIDMYAAGDFSVNAEGSINLRANNNINLDAGANVNAVAAKNWNLEACEVFNATGTTGMKLSTSQNMNILADSQFKMTGQRIDLNGPPAERATLPTPNSLVTNSAVGKSVAGRVPEAEPYGGHDCRNEGEQPTVAPGSPGVPDAVINPAPESYEDTPAPEETDAVDCVPEPTKGVLSDEGFKILKSREAYCGIMYSDFQGYSIGYGIRLDIFGPGGGGKIDENLKQALLAGPSEAEARLASRQIVDRENTPRVMRALEKAKSAASGKTVCITQSQIDGLIMASYGSPVSADKMATALVEAAAATADGKATNEDIAKIWANTPYNNDSKIRNSDAKYVMTGKPNPDTRIMEPAQLQKEGINRDLSRLKSNKVQLPQTSDWRSPLGNGGATGTRVGNTYGKPTPQHLAQWERSYYLNTGGVPYGSNLSSTQLRDKYGAPHTGGNMPPGAPTKSFAGDASNGNVG
jgi:hypothetical protein